MFSFGNSFSGAAAQAMSVGQQSVIMTVNSFLASSWPTASLFWDICWHYNDDVDNEDDNRDNEDQDEDEDVIMTDVPTSRIDMKSEEDADNLAIQMSCRAWLGLPLRTRSSSISSIALELSTTSSYWSRLAASTAASSCHGTSTCSDTAAPAAETTHDIFTSAPVDEDSVSPACDDDICRDLCNKMSELRNTNLVRFPDPSGILKRTTDVESLRRWDVDTWALEAAPASTPKPNPSQGMLTSAAEKISSKVFDTGANKVVLSSTCWHEGVYSAVGSRDDLAVYDQHIPIRDLKELEFIKQKAERVDPMLICEGGRVFYNITTHIQLREANTRVRRGHKLFTARQYFVIDRPPVAALPTDDDDDDEAEQALLDNKVLTAKQEVEIKAKNKRLEKEYKQRCRADKKAELARQKADPTAKAQQEDEVRQAYKDGCVKVKTG